jgi:hypothetical protein
MKNKRNDNRISRRKFIGDAAIATAAFSVLPGHVLGQNIQLFPPDHIWNVPIDTMPADSKSATYIGALGKLSLQVSLGFPYNIVTAKQKKLKITFRYDWASDNVLYPVPDNPVTEGYDDNHLLIVDQDAHMLYEIFDWRGKQRDGTYLAGSGATFDLSGYALRPKGRGSADAAGLAMLPGVFKYEEVAAGEIKHAIRFTSPFTQNKYVWPARSGGTSNNTSYPPYGQRFRLKASFATTGYPLRTRIILNALKKYGMILADAGDSGLYICGTRDVRWSYSDSDLVILKKVKGSDFEAVNVSSLMIDENSGQARVT